MDNYIYKDLNYDPTNALDHWVYDEDSIQQLFESILSTETYERLFRKKVVGDIESLLFEPMSEDVAFMLYSNIYSRLNSQASIINIDNSTSSIVPNYDKGYYEITIYYSIIGLHNGHKQLIGDLPFLGI